MQGLLTASSVRVQEKRIQETMLKVDPQGVLMRALQISFTNRRLCNVPAALSLDHIEGHHKLIRPEELPFILCCSLLTLFIQVVSLKRFG